MSTVEEGGDRTCVHLCMGTCFSNNNLHALGEEEGEKACVCIRCV